MSQNVIIAGARTPIGRLLGGLKTLSGSDLGGLAIKGALEKSGVSGDQVDYVIMGQVLTAGAGQIPARQAAHKGGIPLNVPALTINKVCLSGINAIALADQLIGAGEHEIIVAGGQESMTQAPHMLLGSREGTKYGDTKLTDHMAYDGLWDALTDQAMGGLTEQINVDQQKFTREEQDVDFTQTSTNFAFASLGNIQRSRDESHFTWVVNARYQFNDDLTGYATIARGSKPGGFDLTRLPNFNNFEYQDEKNTNYEIGLKGALFDNRLQFSSALFLTNYSNFQAAGFDGLNLITSNADLFRSKGGEIEITALPTDGLTLQFQASYVKANYISFPNGTCPPGIALPCDLSGSRLPVAPKVTLGASAEYRTALADSTEGFVRIDGNYKSGIFFLQNLDPSAYQGPRTVFNARLGFETESGFMLEAFARNMFNQKYVNFVFPAPLSSGAYVGYVADRRQVGVRGRFSF